MTAADNDAAIATLRQTVVRHPTYAPAHSILAFALLVSFQVGWMPTSGNKEVAARLAHRAAELDDSDPWAHMALGYLAITDRRTDEAVRHFQVALDLNPNFAAAYGYTGWALVLDGQSEEALRHFSQWMRTSPRDPLTLASIVALLTIVAAVACIVPARRATRLDPLHALRHE